MNANNFFFEKGLICITLLTMHWCVLGAGRAGEEASWLPGRPGVSHPLGQRGGARPHHLPHPQLRLRPPGVRQRLGARHRGLHSAQVGHSQASYQFITRRGEA